MKKFTVLDAWFCKRALQLKEDVKLGAFAFCAKHSQLSFSADQKCEVGTGAFAFTSAMDSMHLGELSYLGAGAFAFSKVCKLEYRELQSIEHFHKNAFFGASIKGPLHKLEQGEYFGNHAKLYDVLVRADGECTDLVMPEGTRFIFHGALKGCKNLKSIQLSPQLCEIGKGVFSPKLHYTEYGNALYFGNKDNPYEILVRAQNCRITQCFVHEDTRFIAQDAFYHCKDLRRIAFEGQGVRMSADVFKDCKKIEEYDGPLAPLAKLEKKHLREVFITEGDRIEKGTIQDAPRLSRLWLHEDLLELHEGAISNCPVLEEVMIPLSVKTVDYAALTDCPSLTVICEAKEPGEDWDRAFARGVHAVRWDGYGSASVNYFYDLKNRTACVHSYTPKTEEDEILIPMEKHGYPVTKIADSAFAHTRGFQSVKVEATQIDIGVEAFYKSEDLVDLFLEEGAGIIRERAFAGCTLLERITIPQEYGIDSIHSYAFDGCSNLVEMIASSVKKVDKYAFRNCTSLARPIFPEGQSIVFAGTFSGCSDIRTVIIPEGVTVIEAEAFQDCTSLTELILPSTLTRIERDAFRNCTALTGLCLPEGIEHIGDRAFTGCHSLSSVEGLAKYVGEDAFRDCSALTKVSITKTVDLIGDRAFMGCRSLTSVTGKSFAKKLGAEAFCDCVALEEIALCNQLELIGERAFKGCEKLSSVTLPHTLCEMGDACFMDCKSLKEIQIPDSVQTLGRYLFKNCEALSQYSMPQNITRFTEGIFENCGITKLVLPSSIIAIESRAFAGCFELGEVNIPDTVTQIGSYAFHKCGNIATLTIGGGVETVEEHAFEMCGSLREVRLGDGIVAIAPYAFAYCGKMSDIKFGKKVSRILEGAFAYCNALNEIVFPKSLRRIGPKAFFYSRNIKTVWIAKSVSAIGAEAFVGCDNLCVNCAAAEMPQNWNAQCFPQNCDVHYGVETGFLGKENK